MAKKYVMGADFGTTGVKCVILDLEGNILGSGSCPTPTTYPRPGYAEIDPDMVTERTLQAAKIALERSDVDPADIIGISSSSICSSIVPMDADGKYIYPFIPWNDTRCYEVFDFMRECMAKEGDSELDDYMYTGYGLQGNCTLPSMIWVQKNEPKIYARTAKFINAQSVITRAFTGGNYYDDEPGVTFSKLADVQTLTYSPERAKRYGFDFDKMPEVRKTCEQAGVVGAEAAAKTGLKQGTPVFVGAGDVMCATVGAGVAEDGVGCVVVGTGGNVNAYSSTPKLHPQAKFPVHGSPVGGWHLMGSCGAAASSLTYFVDTFCQAEKAYASIAGRSVFEIVTEYAAKSPAGANGAVYYPWLIGADCPKFNANARGTFSGLSFVHTKADIARAVLEGVAMELRSMLLACEEALQNKFYLLRMMGGGAKSDLWAQIFADVNNIPVEIPACDEAAALAAGLYAAVGAGEFENVLEGTKKMVKIAKRFEPNPENVERYQELYQLYEMTYSALAPEVFEAQAAYQKKYIKG